MQEATKANTIVHARPMFKDLLNRYREKNRGLLPQHILFFRDGASEGELSGIRDTEGRELRRLCQESGEKISITIIVAIKRHHTRFFAEGGLATKLG